MAAAATEGATPLALRPGLTPLAGDLCLPAPEVVRPYIEHFTTQKTCFLNVCPCAGQCRQSR